MVEALQAEAALEADPEDPTRARPGRPLRAGKHRCRQRQAEQEQDTARHVTGA